MVAYCTIKRRWLTDLHALKLDADWITHKARGKNRLPAVLLAHHHAVGLYSDKSTACVLIDINYRGYRWRRCFILIPEPA